MSQIRYQYYVEGDCERKLIEELKTQKNMIRSGKITVLNVIEDRIRDSHLRLLSAETVVILVFDTDTGKLGFLKSNMELLHKSKRVREIWCVTQCENLEDELIRSTDIHEIKELLGSRSNKEFKHDFIHEKRLFGKLEEHGFDYSKLWIGQAKAPYDFIQNQGKRIKLG